jgi:hypothetical protein
VTTTPESPARDKSLRPNSRPESEASNQCPQPNRSQGPESPAPLGQSLRLQQVDTESLAGDKSLWPNSGWTSEPSDPIASQGRNSRPESPGHRARVSPGYCNRFILWRSSPPLPPSRSNPLNYRALNPTLDFRLRSFHPFWLHIRETLDQPRKFANINSKVNPPHVVNKHQNTLLRKMPFQSPPFWCLMTTYGLQDISTKLEYIDKAPSTCVHIEICI